MEFVYLATNERMPGLVKIGSTGNVTKRMKELSAPTSVVGEFVSPCFCATENAHAVEIKLHKMFTSCRAERNREFFEMDWRTAAVVLVSLATRNNGDENYNEKQNSGKTAPGSNGSLDKVLLPAVELSRSELARQDNYMRYITEYIKAIDVQERSAEDCDKHLQYLAKEVNVRSVYCIVNIDRAKTIRDKLRQGGELYPTDQRIGGGMLSAMDNYVLFLQDKNNERGSDYHGSRFSSLRKLYKRLESWHSGDKGSTFWEKNSEIREIDKFLECFHIDSWHGRWMRETMEEAIKAVDGRNDWKERLAEVITWDWDQIEIWFDGVKSFWEEKRKNDFLTEKRMNEPFID